MVRPWLRVHLEALTPTSVHADLICASAHLAVTGDLDGPRLTLVEVGDGPDASTIRLHPRPSTEVFSSLRAVLPSTTEEVLA